MASFDRIYSRDCLYSLSPGFINGAAILYRIVGAARLTLPLIWDKLSAWVAYSCKHLLALISKQINNTCFDLKNASGVEAKASISG